MSGSNRYRRYVLRAVASVGLAALAGCGDGPAAPGTDEGESDGDREDGTTGRDTTGRTTTENSAGGTTTDDGGGDTTTESGAETVDPSVVEGIERVAVPFETAEPTGSLGGLEPVVADLADATVVGMGEATHGTREFQTVRARLVRGLVADAGFRAVAFEENFGRLQRTNEYVVDGEGTLDDAMTGFHDYLFGTETVRELLGWLRAFNDGQPRDDRVGVYGVDVQNATAPARRVQGYLERVDPAYLDTTEADPLTEVAGWSLDRASYDQGEVDRLFDLVETLRSRLQGHRDAYVAASSRAEWQLAVRSVWNVEASARRGEAQQEGDTAMEQLMAGYEVREETMAANATWIQRFAPGDGLALWAHNSHVQRGTIDRGRDGEESNTMGEFVADRLGSAYHPLVLTFGSGRLTARRRSGTTERFVVDDPAPDTLATVLSAVDHPSFYLDFDAVSEDSDVATWLDESHRIHRVGSVWGGDVDTVEIRPRTDADGLIFVRETTATAPLSDGEDE